MVGPCPADRRAGIDRPGLDLTGARYLKRDRTFGHTDRASLVRS